MNKKFIIQVVIGFILILNFECDGKLPSNIKICSRRDPNIAKCIIESVRDLQPRLASGKLSNDFQIPPLEPLKLDNIHIDRGPNFQVFITNLVVTKGASRFIIDKLKANLNEPSFDFLISLPRLEYRGKYKLHVKLPLVAPINGNGDMIGVAENYKSRVKLNAKTYQKNGKTYLQFDKIQIKIIPGKSKIEMKNLFENNPTLGRIGNVFVSENSESFVSEILPALEKSLSEIFTNAANEVVKSASWDEMFPNI